MTNARLKHGPGLDVLQDSGGPWWSLALPDVQTTSGPRRRCSRAINTVREQETAAFSPAELKIKLLLSH